MKQSLALEPNCAQVVEYVYSRAGIVIEIVSDSCRELCNRTTCRPRRTIRLAVDLKSSADDAHVAHWSNSEFLIAPAIGIHRAEVAEPQISGRIQIGGEGFTAESKTAAQTCVSIPGSLRVAPLKLVLSARSSMGKADFETKLVAKVEVSIERDD